ncbi:hypothetical protein V8C35DRAFT_69870 [Trichoderma chlorosporum]
MAVRSIVATLLLASSALARTDLAGCTYTDVVVQPSGLPGYDAYASRIYYVPGTGELCDFLDCGGGRAPPKTDVPGCPLYSGTATYSPSYLNLQTKAAAAAGEATATGTAGSSDVTVTSETQVETKSTAAPATTFETSASETASKTDSAAQTTAAPTTAAPVKSSASSTVTASKGLTTGAPGRNGTATGAHPSSTFTTNGAAPTGVAILGSCLIAGVAACVGLL